jgi:glycosyltransferase involved in cell wall biosynthesis
MKKVLMVGADFVMGGIPAIVDTIVSKESSELEFHVTVTPGKNPGPGIPSFSNAIIHRYDLSYALVQLPQRVLALRKIILDHSVDVVHLHAARAGLVGTLAALGTKAKIVYTGHGWRSQQLPPSLKREFIQQSERFIGHRADTLTFLTEGEKQYGLKHKLFRADHGRVISTRIDADRFEHVRPELLEQACTFLKAKPGTFIVGMVGRLHPEKDPLLFIEIAKKFLEVFPTVDFVWVGEGELRPTIETALKSFRHADRIRFPGAVSRDLIPAVLKTFDGLLLTSHYESLPVCLIEAYAAQLPVMARYFDGIENFLPDSSLSFVLDSEYTKVNEYLSDMTKKALRISEKIDKCYQFFLESFCDQRIMVRDYVDTLIA